jgi:hypothetical protein
MGDQSMGLFRRIWGLVVIVRALFPVLFLAAVIIITRQITHEVRAAVAEPIARVNDSVDRAQETVRATQDAIDDLNQNVGSMVERANSINEKLDIDLGKVREAVGVRPFTLADKLLSLVGLTIEPDLVTKPIGLSKSVDILGLGQIKGVFGQVAELFRDVARISGIATVASDVEAIVGETRGALKSLAAIAVRWGRIVLVLTLLCVAMILISYLEYLSRELPRGWALLAGRPDPRRQHYRT